METEVVDVDACCFQTSKLFSKFHTPLVCFYLFVSKHHCFFYFFSKLLVLVCFSSFKIHLQQLWPKWWPVFCSNLRVSTRLGHAWSLTWRPWTHLARQKLSVVAAEVVAQTSTESTTVQVPFDDELVEGGPLIFHAERGSTEKDNHFTAMSCFFFEAF